MYVVDNQQDATAVQDLRQGVGAASAAGSVSGSKAHKEENERSNLASRHTIALQTPIGAPPPSAGTPPGSPTPRSTAGPPLLPLQAVNQAVSQQDATAMLTLRQIHQGLGAASGLIQEAMERNRIGGLREKHPEQQMNPIKLEQEGVHTLAAELLRSCAGAAHCQVVSTAMNSGCL